MKCSLLAAIFWASAGIALVANERPKYDMVVDRIDSESANAGAETDERAVAECVIKAADVNRVLLLGSLHESSYVIVADYSRYLIRKSGCGTAKMDDRLIVAVHALAVDRTSDARRRRFFESYLADKVYVPSRAPQSLSELAKDLNAEIGKVWPSAVEFRPYVIAVRDDVELAGMATEKIYRGSFKAVFASLAKTLGVLYYSGDDLIPAAIPPDLP